MRELCRSLKFLNCRKIEPRQTVAPKDPTNLSMARSSPTRPVRELLDSAGIPPSERAVFLERLQGCLTSQSGHFDYQWPGEHSQVWSQAFALLSSTITPPPKRYLVRLPRRRYEEIRRLAQEQRAAKAVSSSAGPPQGSASPEGERANRSPPQESPATESPAQESPEEESLPGSPAQDSPGED
jgi:hypothetical protein